MEWLVKGCMNIFIHKKKLIGDNTDVYGFSSGVLRKIKTRIAKRFGLKNFLIIFNKKLRKKIFVYIY